LFKNDVEGGDDFCEAYKSQILNNGTSAENSSVNTFSKVITILLLLIIIVAVSIYGYKYIINSSSIDEGFPPESIQMIDDTELVVTEEDEELPPASSMPPETKVQTPNTEIKEIAQTNTVKAILVKSTPKVEEFDIEKMANDVKLAIAETEELTMKDNSKEESLSVPTKHVQAVYLEELAELSEELDK